LVAKPASESVIQRPEGQPKVDFGQPADNPITFAAMAEDQAATDAVEPPKPWWRRVSGLPPWWEKANLPVPPPVKLFFSLVFLTIAALGFVSPGSAPFMAMGAGFGLLVNYVTTRRAERTGQKSETGQR
jgi:hypothetical protein